MSCYESGNYWLTRHGTIEPLYIKSLEVYFLSVMSGFRFIGVQRFMGVEHSVLLNSFVVSGLWRESFICGFVISGL